MRRLTAILQRRKLLVGLAVVATGVVALWVGVHETTWLGPALADTTRAVVGPKPVAWAEDVAYGIRDRYHQWRHKEDAPTTYWSPVEAVPIASSSGSAVNASFPPKPFAPPHPHVATPADGKWVALGATTTQHGQTFAVKTMVHPDSERPYTVLAIVAMQRRKVRLHAVPGTVEPREPKLPPHLRTGKIPPNDTSKLLAAFNGGFQTIHGGYAMMVDGHTLGTPVTDSCTIALFSDGTLQIASWPDLKDAQSQMDAYRQTPSCLVEHGKRHPELDNAYNTAWGAVVGGKTVIRRSALGLSEDRETIFFGMGDSLTARSLADGMRHAGAHDVAQLDVNHVFPRFLLFGKTKGGVEATEPLCDGFSYSPDDYIGRAMPRDFFYVTYEGD